MPEPYVLADYRLRLACSDPGAYVKRRHDLGPEGDEHESVPRWQARAVEAVLAAAGVALPPEGGVGG